MNELYLHLVCLHDIDDAVKNNPIILLFNHEVITMISLLMAPTLNSETVICWLLSIRLKYSVYVGQETEKSQLILNCLIYER